MVDRTGRPPPGRGHVQRVENPPGRRIQPHGPARDPARERVRHDGEVQEASPRRDGGDVRDPEPIRRVGAEVPVDEVGGWPHPFVAEGGARSPSTADAGEAFLLHQPLDALGATRTPASFNSAWMRGAPQVPRDAR